MATATRHSAATMDMKAAGRYLAFFKDEVA
jgi:hypothetical protein